MAKLSTQLQADKSSDRLTRTQRVSARQVALKQRIADAKEQAKYDEAREKLENAEYRNYKEIYNSIDPKYREGYITPAELEKTEGYQQWEQQGRVNDAYKLLDEYIARTIKKYPYTIHFDSNFIQVRKAFESAGLDPKEAEQTYIQAVESSPSYEYAKAKNQGYFVDPSVYIVPATQQKIPLGQALYEGKISGQNFEKAQEIYDEYAGQQRAKEYQEFLEANPPVQVKGATSNVYDVADDRKWYEKSLQELFIQPAKTKVKEGFSFVTGKAKQGLGIADEYIKWDIGGTASFPKLSISFGKESNLDAEGLVTSQQEKITEKALGIKEAEIEKELGTETYAGFKTEQEEKGKKEVTGLFYRSEIGKQAFMDATTEEEVNKAFEQYKESTEFKEYEKQYSEQYKKDLDQLIYEEVPYKTKLKGTYAGVKIAGLNLGSLGLSLIKTPTRAGLTAGALYGGSAVVSSLPASVLVGVDVAFGTVGAVKTFSPSSTIEERGAGAIMLGVSTASLGIKGISYARQPTVKVVKIKPPKATLKASQSIGKDVKIITDQGTINKIIYGDQKLSQYGIAGRRTVVSTKWRDFLGVKPVYQGVPYAQRGTTYTLTSFRGTTSFTTKSGYQKAYDLLVKRGGYTNYQATQTLRYVQPKVIEQYLNKGILTVKGSSATGQFTYLTKQPVINVDDLLGIKTRGARTIKDIYDVERKLVTLDSGGKFVLEDRTRLSLFLKRGSSPFDFKDLEYSRSVIIGKGSGTRKGFELLKTDIKDMQAFKSIEYQDIAGISFRRNLFPSENALRIEGSRASLIKKEIDLTTNKYLIKPANIKKTPFSKTFGSETEVQSVKNIIRDMNKVSGGGNVNKIIKEINKIEGSTAPAKSQYYGTGLYERTAGGLTPQSNQQLQTILKQQISPPDILVKDQIKTLIGVKSRIAGKTGLLLETVSAYNLKQVMNMDLKMDLKTDYLLKTELKQSPAVKQILTPQLKLTPEQATILDIPPITPPIPREPRITEPKFNPPKIPPFWIPAVKSETGSRKRTKQIQELLFLPDFTARAIGLKAETLTEKQAKKRLKKILTGLEIRRGVKLKY